MQQLLVCCAKDASPPKRPTVPPMVGPFTGNPEQHPNRPLLPDASQLQCGPSDFYPKLVGGYVAHLGEFPWLALLGYEGESYHRTGEGRSGEGRGMGRRGGEEKNEQGKRGNKRGR